MIQMAYCLLKIMKNLLDNISVEAPKGAFFLNN